VRERAGVRGVAIFLIAFSLLALRATALKKTRNEEAGKQPSPLLPCSRAPLLSLQGNALQ
jgi:hypothetical protein